MKNKKYFAEQGWNSDDFEIKEVRYPEKHNGQTVLYHCRSMRPGQQKTKNEHAAGRYALHACMLARTYAPSRRPPDISSEARIKRMWATILYAFHACSQPCFLNKTSGHWQQGKVDKNTAGGYACLACSHACFPQEDLRTPAARKT